MRVVDGRAVVPLRGGGGGPGVLSLLPRADAGADPLELDVLAAAGQQAALALDRAHLHEQSASVARELQHSLLAVDPPEDARFQVAAVYRPGVEQLEVGGDWYDASAADDEVLAVVVGDVVGRGLAAASAMGQLRSAVRAVAEPASGRRGCCPGSTGSSARSRRRAWPPSPTASSTSPRAWGSPHPHCQSKGQDDRSRGSPHPHCQITTLPAHDAVRALTERMLADERGRDDVCVLLLS